MRKIIDTLNKKYGKDFWKIVVYGDESGYVETISQRKLLEFDDLEELEAYLGEYYDADTE